MGALLLSIAVLNVVLLTTLLQPYFLGKVPTESENGTIITPPWKNSPGPPGINGEMVGGVYGKNLFHTGVGLFLMWWLYVAFPLISTVMVLATIMVNTDFSYLGNPDPYGLEELLEERSDLYPQGRNDTTHLIQQFLQDFKPSPSFSTSLDRSLGSIQIKESTRLNSMQM